MSLPGRIFFRNSRGRHPRSRSCVAAVIEGLQCDDDLLLFVADLLRLLQQRYEAARTRWRRGPGRRREGGGGPAK